MSNPELAKLVTSILAQAKTSGRDTLPWRIERSPYTAFISEIMLQQTQVDRVVPKYEAFLEALPSFQALAEAPQALVLTLWSGLGYNRRALALHRAAKMVVEQFGGELPRTEAELIQLPGVGPATAGSLRVYAYNEAVPFIETNVRAVFLHHFFSDSTAVSDKELSPLIEEALLYCGDPYTWYSALMDYGTELKKSHKNPARKSKHHQKQSTFEGSDRQVRGAIIRYLTKHQHASLIELQSHIKDPQHRVHAIAQQLVKEGFIISTSSQYRLL